MIGSRQIGNLSKNAEKNPQTLRVYDKHFVAPTLTTMGGAIESLW